MTAEQANRFRERAELLRKELEQHATSTAAGAEAAAYAAYYLRSAEQHLKDLRGAVLCAEARRRKRRAKA